MCQAPPLSPGEVQARQPVVLASLGGTSQTRRQPLLHEPTARPSLWSCRGPQGRRPGRANPSERPLPDRPSLASLPHGALQGGWGERRQTVLPQGKLFLSPGSFEKLFPLRYKLDLTCRRSLWRGGGCSPFLGSHCGHSARGPRPAPPRLGPQQQPCFPRRACPGSQSAAVGWARPGAPHALASLFPCGLVSGTL